NLDNRVVHATSHQRREQMFDRGDHHTRFHQGRGVTDVRDPLRRGRNFEVVQVGAAKNVTRVSRGGLHLDVYRGIVVKPCSTHAEFGANRRLFAQAGNPFQYRADGSVPRVVASESSPPATARVADPTQSASHFRAYAGATRKCFFNKDV